MALEPRTLARTRQADSKNHNALGRTRRGHRDGSGNLGSNRRRGRFFRGGGVNFRRFFFDRKNRDDSLRGCRSESLRDGALAAGTTTPASPATAAATLASFSTLRPAARFWSGYYVTFPSCLDGGNFFAARLGFKIRFGSDRRFGLDFIFDFDFGRGLGLIRVKISRLQGRRRCLGRALRIFLFASL